MGFESLVKKTVFAELKCIEIIEVVSMFKKDWKAVVRTIINTWIVI